MLALEAPTRRALRTTLPGQEQPMSLHAIISYDDTQNDHDALMLGRLLAGAGAKLTVAYVRHTVQRSPDREELEIHEAQALLERGVRWLADPYGGAPRGPQRIDRRGPRLARRAGAGRHRSSSDPSTAPPPATSRWAARRRRCWSADRPLWRWPRPGIETDGEREIATIGVLPGSADEAAIETAFSLAGRFGGQVVDRAHGVDLLVVGSRPEAPDGRVMISARSRERDRRRRPRRCWWSLAASRCSSRR